MAYFYLFYVAVISPHVRTFSLHPSITEKSTFPILMTQAGKDEEIMDENDNENDNDHENDTENKSDNEHENENGRDNDCGLNIEYIRDKVQPDESPRTTTLIREVTFERVA
jgi:hypothetical protein